MASFTISEAIARINGYLDKVTREAEAIMKEEIRNNADKGYATGALAASVDTRVISDSARGIGSSLSYAEYVNKGRGPVTAKNPSGRLHYYDTKLGKWMHPVSVAPMSGIDFTGKTKAALESMHIPL